MVVILQVFDTFGPMKEVHSCQLPGSCGRWDWRNTSSLRSRWGSTLSLPYPLTLSPLTPSPLHTLDLLALYSLPCFFTAPHSSPSHTSSHPTLPPPTHPHTHTLLPLSNMHPHTHTHFCHPHILTTAHSSLPHSLHPHSATLSILPLPHILTPTLSSLSLTVPHMLVHPHSLQCSQRESDASWKDDWEIPAEVCGLRRVWDDVCGVWRLKYVCEMWGVHVVYMWHSMNEGTLLGDCESMTGGTHGTWS